MRRLRWLLTLVPSRWRDAVAIDLHDEADGRALAGWRRHLWLSWHIVAIGAALRTRGAAVPAPVRTRSIRGGGLRTDVASGIRVLTQEPATSATIVVTLSLGIAATSAVYAVFNHVAFRPTPGIHDPATLVSILFQPEDEPRTWAYGSSDAVSVFEAADPAVLAVAARSGSPSPTVFAAQPGDMPRLVDVGYVAPSYFDVLGVRPRIGRLFSNEETKDGGAVALISEALWRREYGQRLDAIGTPLYVNDRPYTIVGVVDDYRGWGSTAANTGDVWLPEPEAGARSSTVSLLVARVVPGASPEALQNAFRAAYEPLRAQVPARMANFVPWVYAGLRDGPNERGLGISFPRVVTVASLLALLACANAANLLLARHGRRRQGFNVRRAIGASRWRLMRPLVVEALCLALLAVAGGLGGAWLLVRFVDGVQVFSNVAALRDIGIDWRVSAFAAAAGVCTVLAFALVPIALATRNETRIVLDHATRTTTSSHRVRTTLVAAQIALSLALMTTAVLMTRSLGSLRAVDLGMAPVGVMSFTLNPRLIGATGADADQLIRRALETLQAMPDVAAVGTANPSPFNQSRNSRLLRQATSDGEIELTIERTTVSADYFAAVGVPVLAGRTFSAVETATVDTGGHRVGLINESLARRLFGGESAIGRIVVTGAPFGDWKPSLVTIIGVVGDTRTSHTLRDTAPAAMLYEPGGGMFVFSRVFVRPRAADNALQAHVYAEMQRVAPGLPLVEAGSLADEVERLMPEDAAIARVLELVALVAMLLAASGVYAVMSTHVVERTRDFGVRLALGASPVAILQHLAKTMRVTVIVGACVGLAVYGGIVQLLASRLHGVAPLDVPSLAVAVAILAMATLVAAWLPARRASRIDPVQALRAE